MRLVLGRIKRGITLVEVMIASGVLTIVAVASISAMLVATKIARAAQQDMMALELINRQVELVRSEGLYSELGTTRFVGTSDPVQYDPNFPDNGPTFTTKYEWWGFGTVASATANTITCDVTNWPADIPDFVGHHLIMRADNQIAEITAFSRTGNTATITINYGLNGYTNTNWGTIPQVGAPFEIDGGKECRVTINWTTAGRDEREIVRQVWVPWRAN